MLHQQIAQNKRKTVMVVALYFVLFTLIGWGVGYMSFGSAQVGLMISLIGGGIYTWMMISQSTSVVMRLNHAREITHKEQFPMLYNIVEDMAMVAQVPMPKIYVIDDPSPNAFATGMSPDKAAVAATTGLLERLNREELEGVMAHEFAHIKNYDVRLQTIAVALGAVIAMLVQFSSTFFRFGGMTRRRRDDREQQGGLEIIMMIVSMLAVFLGPLMATIMQYALSRNREYLADATAVSFTRNPQGLISALEKISGASAMKQADPQSAALYISNPFKKSNEEKDSLFSTHPATSNRIKKLREM